MTTIDRQISATETSPSNSRSIPSKSNSITPRTQFTLNSSSPSSTFFSSADIQAQINSLLCSSSSSIDSIDSENLDHLVAIIKNIHRSKQQDAFLKHLNKFIIQNESLIETVCRDHYQDFLGSVDKLLSVRQRSISLKSHVIALDSSLQSSGTNLRSSRSTLLDTQKVLSNIDDTIETLESCLKVLDLSKKLSQQISDAKFYSALRSLDELQFVHLKPLLGFAAFAGYLGQALPNEKIRIREDVTKQLNSWLYDARQQSQQLGRSTLEALELRERRWKTKKDRFNPQDPASIALFVGLNTSVELAVGERHDYNVLDSTEEGLIDFGPLYLAIHIHETLDAIEELRKSFRDDRRAQAHLILASMPNSNPILLDQLSDLTEQIVGFLIIETQVLKTTKGFRDENDVDGLWEEMSERVVQIVREGLKDSKDPDLLLGVRNKLLLFSQTLEAYEFNVNPFYALLTDLSKDYTGSLYRQLSVDFEQFIQDDDHQPMIVNNEDEFSKVAEVSFLPSDGNWSKSALANQEFPTALPFSQAYPLCCIDIRSYVTKHHTFCESIDRHVEDSIRKALDSLLISHVGLNMFNQIQQTRNLSQLTQIVINILFFSTACDALEIILVQLRASVRIIEPQLESKPMFTKLLKTVEEKIVTEIQEKIKDFFELSEYDWRKKQKAEIDENSSSSYLRDCLNFVDNLITNVLILTPLEFNENVFFGAWLYIGQRLKSFLIDREPAAISDGGLSILSNDVRFAFKKLQTSNFSNSSSSSLRQEVHKLFEELVQTINLLGSPDVANFLDLDYRKMKFNLVPAENVPLMLLKLLMCMNSVGSNVDPLRKSSVEEVLKALSPA